MLLYGIRRKGKGTSFANVLFVAKILNSIGETMQNIRKWGAYLGAGAVIFTLAGCADRNNNGQPDSAATTGEVANSVDATGDKMAGATENAASAAGNAASNAGDAMSNAASGAGNAMSNAASSAGNAISNLAEAATMTPAVKTAIGGNNGLKGTKIDVDTLGSKDSIALRGNVKTAQQKTLAEGVAKKAAPGYKIINQLKVVK